MVMVTAGPDIKGEADPMGAGGRSVRSGRRSVRPSVGAGVAAEAAAGVGPGGAMCAPPSWRC